VAISLSNPSFCTVTRWGTRLQCGAGARLKAVCQEAKRHALTGFEFLDGIPGTIGGALHMNAGAMGGSIFELVDWVRLMDAEGNVAQVQPVDMEVGYRRCARLRSHIALETMLRGRPGDREAIEARLNEFNRKRWDSQPAAPSAGCMFKNPPNISAGRLIEELGLKGTRVGDAMVSIEHGNFLVNGGAATAGQVLELIDLIRRRARDERGIELETEVEVLGE
jgi:UDP-N-acetylenolpyruvoylglucosamine reductase